MAWTPPIPEPVWNTASPEVQAAILALVEFYEQRLAKLEARVNDLENRLKLNSTNSSKPPSSDPIGMKRKPPASPSGKKRGGQPGHRKAYRALVPPEKIHETFHCKPTACRRCGHGLSGDDPAGWSYPVTRCQQFGAKPTLSRSDPANRAKLVELGRLLPRRQLGQCATAICSKL